MAREVFLLLALCTLVLGLPPKQNENQRRFLENMNRSSKYKCGRPQPRSVRVSDFHVAASTEKYDPSQVVLHRCEGSGTCGYSSHDCVTKEKENVTLWFTVEIFSPDDKRLKRYEFASLSVTNHTECECK